jgi:hypothetical protein
VRGQKEAYMIEDDFERLGTMLVDGEIVERGEDLYLR